MAKAEQVVSIPSDRVIHSEATLFFQNIYGQLNLKIHTSIEKRLSGDSKQDSKPLKSNATFQYQSKNAFPRTSFPRANRRPSFYASMCLYHSASR